MAWNLAGSYFETCSCDARPSTASPSPGATGDRNVILDTRYEAGMGFSASELDRAA